MALITWADVDPRACRQTVYYEGSDTVLEGMAVCYNQDTTTNWSNVDKSAAEGAATFDTTTPEGSQNEGKWIRVEKPASANLPFLAGFVAKGSNGIGQSGPVMIDIYTANGASIPVRGTESFTIGEKVYIAAADYEVTNVPQVGGFVGHALETIDRSSTEGLVLCQIHATQLEEELVTVQTVVNAASPFTVTAAMSGRVFDNTGASGSVEFDLPAAATATGCRYTFTIAAAQTIVIDPNGTEVILFGNDADVLAAGEALTLTPADTNDAGMHITIVSNGTKWVPVSAWAPLAAKFVIP